MKSAEVCALCACANSGWNPPDHLIAGGDQEKHKLNAALEQVFQVCKQHYLANPSQTGADFFDFVRK